MAPCFKGGVPLRSKDHLEQTPDHNAGVKSCVGCGEGERTSGGSLRWAHEAALDGFGWVPVAITSHAVMDSRACSKLMLTCAPTYILI